MITVFYIVTCIVFNKILIGPKQIGSIGRMTATRQEVEAWQWELWEEESLCLQSSLSREEARHRARKM